MAINEFYISSFLGRFDYDVRKTGDARWIDQKCTMDVVSIIADCIYQYVNNNPDAMFSVKTIWNTVYAKDIVDEVFSKPSVLSEKVSNEYDKFFGQPIKLLSYAGIISSVGKAGRSILYKVNDLNLLYYISQRDRNALLFLQLYIEKVLKDSNLWDLFDNFFKYQDKNSFEYLKDSFESFTISNTNINGKTECGRIFTKILNPIAFKYKKCGTERGRLSKSPITMDMLLYNQPNWRDILAAKPKNMSRVEYLIEINTTYTPSTMQAYKISKAKQMVRDYNVIRDSLSEVEDIEFKLKVKATQMHHIFPVAYFPDISASVENLIALTPNQHNVQAHPNNNTSRIDTNFQKICLFEKIQRIKESFNEEFTIYSFDDLINVLNTGFETNRFSQVKSMDFDTIIDMVNEYYK